MNTIKPFYEETTHDYEVEMYSAEDVAANGEMATKKSFRLRDVFNLVDIKNKAIEFRFDSFEIIETQYKSKHYSVE